MPCSGWQLAIGESFRTRAIGRAIKSQSNSEAEHATLNLLLLHLESPLFILATAAAAFIVSQRIAVKSR